MEIIQMKRMENTHLKKRKPQKMVLIGAIVW